MVVSTFARLDLRSDAIDLNAAVSGASGTAAIMSRHSSTSAANRQGGHAPLSPKQVRLSLGEIVRHSRPTEPSGSRSIRRSFGLTSMSGAIVDRLSFDATYHINHAQCRMTTIVGRVIGPIPSSQKGWSYGRYWRETFASHGLRNG